MIAWVALTLALAALSMAEAARRDAHTARRRAMHAREQALDANRAVVAAIRADRQERIESRLRELGRTPRIPVVFRAGAGEDLFLYDLLKPLDGDAAAGTFLEVGAYDGVRYSVTSIFESIGWSGVLIEPIEEHADACRAARPNSRVVHAALGAPGSPSTAEFTLLDPKDEVDTDTASFLTTHDAHRAKMRRSIERASRTVTVPLRTMTSVLDEASDRPCSIDLAVIDVEGGELDLIRGFDLERYRVRVLLVEDLTAGSDASVRTLLESHGYERVARVARNDLYIHRSEHDLVHRARDLTTYV